LAMTTSSSTISTRIFWFIAHSWQQVGLPPC
jgi:hypothetical protein